MDGEKEQGHGCHVGRSSFEQIKAGYRGRNRFSNRRASDTQPVNSSTISDVLAAEPRRS
jgi:hypothetical protein